MELDEKYLQTQKCGHCNVLDFNESQGNARAHFEISRRARIRSRCRSTHAHAEKKNSEEMGTAQIYKLNNSDKTVFYVPGEEKGMLAPTTSIRPEERELGASMHMMSNKELSSGEVDTVQRSRTPAVVLTANGEVHTHEEAQVFVHDLNQFVTVQLLEETPAVLSLGKHCKDHFFIFSKASKRHKCRRPKKSAKNDNERSLTRAC